MIHLITESGDRITVEDIDFSFSHPGCSNPYRYVPGPDGTITVHLFKMTGEDFPVATVTEERGYASTVIEVLNAFQHYDIEMDVRAVDVRDRLDELLREAGFPFYPDRDCDDGWVPLHRAIRQDLHITMQGGQRALFTRLSTLRAIYDDEPEPGKPTRYTIFVEFDDEPEREHVLLTGTETPERIAEIAADIYAVVELHRRRVGTQRRVPGVLATEIHDDKAGALAVLGLTEDDSEVHELYEAIAAMG